MAIQEWFPTLIYYEKLLASNSTLKTFHRKLSLEIDEIYEQDRAGHEWSKTNYKNGFTSYASVNDLHRRFATFSELEKKISQHIKKYSRALGFDLQGKKLEMTTCWVNIMQPNSYHGLHLHPQSIISGTYYLDVPKQSSPIRFEDPRLDRMMFSPSKNIYGRKKNKISCEYSAKQGYLLLFESWLRHEVPIHIGKKPRVSISFNYS